MITFIILKVLDAVIGLRVTPEEEEQGLDIALHLEKEYILQRVWVDSFPIPTA